MRAYQTFWIIFSCEEERDQHAKTARQYEEEG